MYNNQFCIVVNDKYYNKYLLNNFDELQHFQFPIVKLYMCSVNELPNDIFDFTNLIDLQQLIIHHSNISIIPNNIHHLTKLELLEISFCQLTEIPYTLCNLTELQYLNLCYNKINKLPLLIGNLTKLQQLILDSNELTHLPEETKLLVELDTLWINNNKLTYFPNGLFSLNKIMSFHWFGNLIEKKNISPNNLKFLQKVENRIKNIKFNY